MIETTIPEIQVSDLMQQVRVKAAEIRRIEASGGGSAVRSRRIELPPLAKIAPRPPLFLPKPPPSRKEKILALLNQARERTSVSKWIPKPFRIFFGNQGDYNRALLEGVASLTKSNAELASRVEQLTRCVDVEQQWLAEMQQRSVADSKWTEAVRHWLDTTSGQVERLGEEARQIEFFREEAREQLNIATAKMRAEFVEFRQKQESLDDHARKSTLAAEGALRKTISVLTDEVQGVRRLSETMAERLGNLQVESDRNAHLREAVGSTIHNLQADLARTGEHLRNLQAAHDHHAAELDVLAADGIEIRRSITALDQRQLSDGSYLRMELSQQASSLRQWLSQRGAKNNRKLAAFGKESAIEMPGRLDAFYVSFEDRFRGPRDEIKKRVEIYLPLILEAGAGVAKAPVLDVGCGRGEWLELLKEKKLRASGVDINSAMLAQCRERKLQVLQSDAISRLRTLPKNSLGAVTGFHIIEHLPFDVLMDLFAQTCRVLKPGGIAIFESPNCKNLVVGACNFYVDPTHRNPVFPDTAEFMLASHGFERIRIEYLSPVTGMSLGESKEFATLNQLFYGPQDYGVIAYKPKRK
jgi:SAM-dependent methyltransferase